MSITNTTALFARVSRHSEQVILPINDGALHPMSVPAPAFYCVHSVSGVAGTDFLELAQRLEPTVRFYGVQAPPVRLQDPEFGKSVESLARYYTDALVEFQPHGPFIIGGYCVGAVIALEMAKLLRARGRQVGPLLAIDGMPENTGSTLRRRWQLRYWMELARNIPGWFDHGDLMRNRSLRSLFRSLSSNSLAIGKAIIGLKRGERLGGNYAMDGMMDLSIYPPAHRIFINRLFNALFAYVPEPYPGEVAVYEAKTTPLLYLPQIGHTWRRLAPRSEVVSITGTHIGIMRAPYVDALAADMRNRILRFFSNPESVELAQAITSSGMVAPSGSS